MGIDDLIIAQVCRGDAEHFRQFLKIHAARHYALFFVFGNGTQSDANFFSQLCLGEA